MRGFATAMILITVCVVCGIARADDSLATRAATQPATAANDSPEVKAVRDQLIEWSKTVPTSKLQAVRGAMHTETDEEATMADKWATDTLEVAKLEKRVRDKWGASADDQFAHAVGTDSLEDDQSAEIKVDGDHAQIAWKAKELEPGAVIKVAGKWMLDVHAQFLQMKKKDAGFPGNYQPYARVLRELDKELQGNAFKEFEDFLDAVKEKIGS